MFSLPDMNKIKDSIIDKATDLIADKLKEITDGAVTLDSIVRGQVKIDANGYLDKAAEFLNETLNSNGLNQLNLPELSLPFDQSVACGIVVPGNVDISDGTITGLASFCRMGDAELIINALSEPMLSVKASMGIKQTNIDYSSQISVFCFGPEVLISGNLTDVTLHLDLQVDTNLSFTLHKFEVTHTGDLNLDFKNIGPYEFLTHKMSAELKTSIKETVLEYLEKSVKEFLHQIVSTLPITL